MEKKQTFKCLECECEIIYDPKYVIRINSIFKKKDEPRENTKIYLDCSKGHRNAYIIKK